MNLVNVKQANNVQNHLNRLLDLVFSHFDYEVLLDDSMLVPEDHHHPALIINILNMSTKDSKFKFNLNIKCYNLRKTNVADLYSTNWNLLVNVADTDVILDSFDGKIFSIFDKHINLYKNYSHRNLPWCNSIIMKDIKLKAKFRKKFKKTRRGSDLDDCQRLRGLVKVQLKSAYDNYIEKIQISLTHDPRKLWAYVLSKHGTSKTFVDFFKGVYMVADSNHPDANNTNHVHVCYYPVQENVGDKKVEGKNDIRTRWHSIFLCKRLRWGICYI
nr:unnamed protein product [Callosobruchus chinensis]